MQHGARCSSTCALRCGSQENTVHFSLSMLPDKAGELPEVSSRCAAVSAFKISTV